jgi:hypothetical protein
MRLALSMWTDRSFIKSRISEDLEDPRKVTKWMIFDSEEGTAAGKGTGKFWSENDRKFAEPGGRRKEEKKAKFAVSREKENGKWKKERSRVQRKGHTER